MKSLISLIIVVSIHQSIIYAADAIRYGCAESQDISGLVDLINTDACNASRQIVVVPEAFRQEYVQHGVDAGRFFIVKQADAIVGFKKLFLIDDQQELEGLLCKEIRCIGGNLLAQGVFDVTTDQPVFVKADSIDHVFSSPVTYIYNGADFTHEAHRSKGVNAALTVCALSSIEPQVIEHIAKNKTTYVAMLFGLTHDNAEIEDQLLAGRSKGIVKLFNTFAQNVARKTNMTKPTNLLAARYVAYKPSFDPKSKNCVPLPDEKSIQGCGCILACKLVDEQITC